MHTTNLWYQLNLHRYKIVFVLLGILSFFISQEVKAQNGVRLNLQNYDDRFVHYGFLLGLHNSWFRHEYSPIYTGEENNFRDSLHSIEPLRTPGFKVGFVSNFHLFQYLDFRALIQVSFYEYSLTYHYTKLDQPSQTEVRDPTMVELPLLLKYKSVRRGNVGMYFVGGIKPYFQAAAKGERGEDFTKLETRKFGFALDIGAGFDLYFPLFKFSPEVRYSYGLGNTLKRDDSNPLSAPLQKLVYHNISFFITFEGGPH